MHISCIDIDSLRPDHLSCYGYHRRTGPNIDALARRHPLQPLVDRDRRRVHPEARVPPGG